MFPAFVVCQRRDYTDQAENFHNPSVNRGEGWLEWRLNKSETNPSFAGTAEKILMAASKYTTHHGTWTFAYLKPFPEGLLTHVFAPLNGRHIPTWRSDPVCPASAYPATTSRGTRRRDTRFTKCWCLLDSTEWFVFRRYAEFDKLYNTLRKQFPSMNLKIPAKRIFGDNFDPEFIQQRRAGLHEFIKRLVSHPQLSSHPDVKSFLLMDKLQHLEDASEDEDDKNSSTSRNINLGPSGNPQAKPTDFDFLKVIGKGSFGKVFLAKRKHDGKFYAVKVLQKKVILNRKEQKHIMAERNVLLKNVKHPFLVGLHYSFQTTDKLYFVLDFVNGGELFFHLQKERTFPEPRARFYIAEMASALGYLHSLKIVYRDLKPENILLDNEGHIVLTDFGLCKEGISQTDTTTTFCGTPEYLAPEVLRKHPYDNTVDWWCLGSVLYEMLFGLGLLEKDGTHRLGSIDDFNEIKEHNFFSSINWDDLVQKKIPPPFIPNRTEAVYKFCIRVNPSDVMEIDPLLGDLVLHNPLKATYLFQTVCFLAIKTLSLTEKICTESQVNVTLNFTHLPPFPEYMLDLCKFPRVYGPMRPVCMEGFVIAMTRVTKYTQGARFLCVNDDCPCSTGFHHIRVHTPGATESATVRNDFTCMVCSSQLKEDMKFRVLGDKQLVELIHPKALEALKGNQQSPLRYQSVTVFLRDELCNSMRIGQLYSVLGIPALVHQWPNITWNVEANNVQQSEPKNVPTGCSKLPTKFRELLNGTASSAWRFSAIAAHCFGLEVAPPGLYNTVKFILLLSLVQTNTSINYTFQYLNVLVVTSETLIMDRLMAHSLRLAFRGVRHQASGEMFASLSRDEHGAGAANIHAGSALLATGGICMLGDISCYKKDKLDHIQSVLESHTASVFIPGKKFGEDADQMLSLPVQCSFWALTESSQRSGKLDSAVLGTAEMGPVPLQFSEAFGLIIDVQGKGRTTGSAGPDSAHPPASGPPWTPELSAPLGVFYSRLRRVGILCSGFASRTSPCSKGVNPWILHGEP
ncbi:Serine/threonine-protein kinase Sgk3 [Oryzias melastigma]|uniref:Serine/threonine-protein kinase Sgk3 n=1 Tax=Oryzias melastigma TaxID=30732 RepID=A0A834CCW0_ORYME|nr:Serine/threonine-protein kinase Sgk3 [Oryzias melastigma]